MPEVDLYTARPDENGAADGQQVRSSVREGS
jgi:hypothetical protein